MAEFLSDPAKVGMLFWIMSAAVQSLPEPVEDSRDSYVWLYRFSHALAANVRVSAKRFPGKSEAQSAFRRLGAR